eukprot:3358807-Rhodomonas_salina.1
MRPPSVGFGDGDLGGRPDTQAGRPQPPSPSPRLYNTCRFTDAQSQSHSHLERKPEVRDTHEELRVGR